MVIRTWIVPKNKTKLSVVYALLSECYQAILSVLYLED